MLLSGILMFFTAALACVGFVHLVAWLGIRATCKGNPVYRIFPIGGTESNPGDRMSLMYTCLQWESNPSRQVSILYDTGLDGQNIHDCKVLAGASGVRFVRSPEELHALLTGEGGEGNQCL